ncbi:MAG: VCBS repeat-containing protein [Bacteroidetes bacterium]|nr:VCBS repeat-containing protein [Bacteroidota bacterium]
MKKCFAICFLFAGLNVFSQGFVKVGSEKSGITFSNTITETDMINGLTYEYLYNGGGVSVADFNRDGNEDLFFTSNQGANKLYLNKGNLEFVDVTQKFLGKTQPEGFTTGTTVVDINNDGFPDLYVSRAGYHDNVQMRKNLLYVNQGGKKFVEQAAAYGIADSSNTTQAVFFDADADNDLDLYLLNHPVWRKRFQGIRFDQPDYQTGGEDVYYENVNGKYVNATEKAGLRDAATFGLGITVSDLNDDGYPDIYLTNDYFEADRFYLNNGNGTFRNVIKEKTQHIALYAMGIDIADINNDLLPDIFTVDMASEDHVRSKKNMAGMSTKNFWYYVNVGHHYQYMFNALQLNLGDLHFAEIAQLAGLSKTDWSWAPLLADFDNDGYSDAFITNGYKRDVRDNDFQIYYSTQVKGASEQMNFEEVISKAPAVKVPNYIFKNNGDLSFSKMVLEWGMSEPVNCNGAAYADLDNDGDLDLVVSAMDDPSFILENKIKETSNYFRVKLGGMPGNSMCLGAKVIIETESGKQIREMNPTRGFQSSVSPIIQFGLGNDQLITKLTVIWNKDEQTELVQLDGNSTLELNYTTAVKVKREKAVTGNFVFNETHIKGLDYKHEEMISEDFQKEVLLPNKMSELGPFMSAGDLNGDKLDDLFIGGSRGYPGETFLQNADGTFQRIDQPALLKDRNHEDMGSVFLDADNDGDQDLYVVSGSNECPANHPILKDRLYLNDGKGTLTAAADAVPNIYESGQKVVSHDFNKDGFLDLVVFGRQVPESYPKTPRSVILLNQNGKFVESTSAFAPELENVGMVTDAIFTDFDNDADQDLLMVGEWMPVTVFENQNGKFVNATVKYELSNTVGWWSAISEFTKPDGSKQYILGNIGANNKFHPSANKPLQIYMNDFDENGTNDIVLAKYQGSICYPVRGRQCSSEQMPFIKEKFPTYDQFATADLTQIYTKEKLESAVHFDATIFENCTMTLVNGKFMLTKLPNECQFGAVNSILSDDFNHDGIQDILVLGNKYEAEVETIRYDSNFGVLLVGQKDGTFLTQLSYQSGIYLGKDIKSALILKNAQAQRFVVTLPSRENFSVYSY